MSHFDENKFGSPVPNWTAPKCPDFEYLEGSFSRLEVLSPESHAAMLYRNYVDAESIWDYLPYGPFSSSAQYHRWVRDKAGQTDPMFLAVQNLETGNWEGVASYLRLAPEMGSIEVGHINFSPALQGTRAGTEAMFLMMQWAFEAGYRRYEWKCNALNMESRRAAQRLGFSYEGIFRQAGIVKGRNRDTAWFAAIDKEWPALKEAFSAWLNPKNFDSHGRQIERLSDLTRLVRAADDPAL